MTSKAEFHTQWQLKDPAERRARLNELGANENRTDDEEREHDALAAMVAEDEDEARNQAAKSSVESQDAKSVESDNG